MSTSTAARVRRLKNSLQFWADDLTYNLRNIGFDALGFIFQHLCWDFLEAKKVVVKDSLWKAFSRCWIHVLPVGVFLYLQRLRFRGYYIGEHLGGCSSNDQEDSVTLAFIQVAAKIQVRNCIPFGS